MTMEKAQTWAIDCEEFDRLRKQHEDMADALRRTAIAMEHWGDQLWLGHMSIDDVRESLDIIGGEIKLLLAKIADAR